MKFNEKIKNGTKKLYYNSTHRLWGIFYYLDELPIKNWGKSIEFEILKNSNEMILELINEYPDEKEKQNEWKKANKKCMEFITRYENAQAIEKNLD